MPVEIVRKVRFGPFELDTRTGELRKEGYRVNLHGQPVEVLTILLEQPGELLTREDLCKRLWPQDTFVDFEHSLNTAIKKLRQALDDEVETPRYIETLPKKGYRFIAHIESVSEGPAAVEPSYAPTQVEAEVAPPKTKRWLWSFAALVVLAAAAVAYQFLRPRTPVVTGIHQLTRTGHQKLVRSHFPVVSDGTRLYFYEWGEGRLHLAQISAKGGEVSYLDMSPIVDPWVVDISPDGSELLVLDFRTPGTGSPLWLAALPNGPQRRIDDLAASFAAFWPGSNRFLYTQPSSPTKLFAADLDGGNRNAILTAPDDIYEFSVSPDGKLVRFRTADHRMWEAHLDGSGLHPFLPHKPRPICCGKWTPDGRTYAFVSKDLDGDNLWAVSEPRLWGQKHLSSPVQLTPGPVTFATPTFSKDGKQIFAFGETRRGELASYDASSQEFRPYLNGISAGALDYSPDGQWVAYVTYPQDILWRSRLDGTERLQLTSPPIGPVLNPKWSPDGKLIVFTDYDPVVRGNKIYVVPASGGSPILLVAGDFNPADPTWSPDGKSIVYGGMAAVAGHGTEIRMLNLETRQFTTIADSQHKFSPRWSPDGRYIAAISDDMTKFFLYSFVSNRWEQLPVPSSEVLESPAWSADSQFLFVASGWQNGPIYRFRVPDGRAEVAADMTGVEVACPPFGPQLNWFGLTPDGHIIVLLDRGTEEVYALDLEYR